MGELFRRLASRPGLTIEILVASLLANVLALASSLYVIQVLNRYVSFGVNATLAAMTAGVLIAIVLEFGFRQVRLKLATVLSAGKDSNLATGAFGMLTTARLQALEGIPSGERREIVRGMDAVEGAYNAGNICAVIDVPFALMFAFVLFLLSPVLAGIVCVFLVVTFCYGVWAHRGLRGPTKQLTDIASQGASLITNANQAMDSVRAFNGSDLLVKAWQRYLEAAQPLRRKIGRAQAFVQQMTQSGQALMSVSVYSVGAFLVVQGELDVGVLIGANILSARALGPLIKFAQLGETLTKAEQALERVREFASLPVEPDGGAKIGEYQGQIEYRDAGFSHPSAPAPLFESLDLKLAPGGVLIVTGGNGTGKTTLARLTAGLLELDRGQILVDGVELRQLDPAWWRRQVVYMPQEPTFIAGTLRQNLLAANPDLDEEAMIELIRTVGLGRFLDESEQGLDQPIVNGGLNLAVGQRRRLGLARGLATGGRLAILDEPTESLDEEGCAAVYSVLIDMAKRGVTIIAISRDPQILKGATLLLDLNAKPVPAIRHTQPEAANAGDDAAKRGAAE